MNPKLTEIQKRIKRVSGQIEGIDRMIDEGRDCKDIIQQIIAVRSALASLGVEVIGNESVICKNSPKNSQQHTADLMKSLFKLM